MVKQGHSLDEKKAANRKDPSLRDKGTVRRLKMYRSRVKRDKKGKLLSGSVLNKEDKETRENDNVVRVAPDRRWFGNSRVVGQNELSAYREEMKQKIDDPYSFVLKESYLPMSLIYEAHKNARPDLLSAESFKETFGPKKTRKRPKLKGITSYEDFVQHAEKQENDYSFSGDKNAQRDLKDQFENTAMDKVFSKGQSTRIWNELHKVIDSSDVVIEVIDARDPMGTRSYYVEKFLKKEKKHKHLVLLLNKADLVPTWVTARWVQILSKEYPTLAFHSSITNPFGKGSLIQLLRQFGQLHHDKRSISVGFIGYPNVGKSSIINTLRGKKVCKVAPVPGETKVWQYITLMKRIFLVDCPGVVYHSSGDSPDDLVLKGVVRVENLSDASQHIPAVMNRVKREYLEKTYGVTSWKTPNSFLGILAKKSGKLLKGGVPNYDAVSKRVLYDWQRGNLPWFTVPPFENDKNTDSEKNHQQQDSHSESQVEDVTNEEEQKVNENSEQNQEIEEEETENFNSKLGVEQIFNNIRVDESLRFSRDDMLGTDYSNQLRKHNIRKENPKKQKNSKKGGKQQSQSTAPPVTDWDEVYKGVTGEVTQAPPPGETTSKKNNQDENNSKIQGTTTKDIDKQSNESSSSPIQEKESNQPKVCIPASVVQRAQGTKGRKRSIPSVVAVSNVNQKSKKQRTK
eukprot:gb/GECH01003707.1/.p1 GENE.gb/GECH01003707.1/~~gb/GECH01003707.1/.p1  ORF type:complete len:683 (+),score=208.91 gb/GECH01003707.1/:1-2049(+)